MSLVKPKNPHRMNRLDYTDPIAALILRRRYQILVHSYLYYFRSQILIEDKKFDEWAHELADLQNKYPDISSKVPDYEKEFRGFDGTTGFDLPYKDKRIEKIAEHLIKIQIIPESRSRREGGVKR